MSTFLLKLLELSLQAGALTLAILLVRLIFRKLPAKYLCLLWAIVAVRLVVPFSIEAGFAWAPNLQTMWSVEEHHKIGDTYAVLIEKSVIDFEGNVIESYRADSGDIDYFFNDPGTEKIPIESIGTSSDVYWELIEHTVTKGEGGNDFETSASPTPVPEGTANATFRLGWREFLSSVTPVLFVLWALGIAVLLGYGAVSCLRVKRQVKNAILYEDNIWLCDGLQTPFLFGWRNPQIYLPTNLEDKQIHYVVLHEKAHIARGDNYSKLAGYILLAVYWFNPLIWLAYATFCKDVERACDEKVIDDLEGDDRKDYAEALLECSIDRRFSISNPLAFGEMDVKKRIVRVLNYKTPGRWLVVFTAVLCIFAVTGCFFVRDGGKGQALSAPTLMPTATPTPTGVPSATATPTPGMVPGITSAFLPPKEPTLGEIADGCVIAVPMGHTVEMDLNGDGTPEVISCGFEGYEKEKPISEIARNQTLRELLFHLNINGQEFRKEKMMEAYWSSNPGFTTYYVFDIDPTDNYKEIGLYFDGPGGEPRTALYRFIGRELYCVGVFESAVLESDYSRNSMDYENVPYEEMVQTVNRKAFVISVPGDGTLLCRERHHFIETAEVVSKHTLWYSDSGKTAELKEITLNCYVFSNWGYDNGEFNKRAAKDFYAYLEPTDMSINVRKDAEVIKIREGTRIDFVAFYPDNEWIAGWVLIAYGDNLENFAWLYKGLDPIGNGVIYLPTTTERNPAELFENLNNAG